MFLHAHTTHLFPLHKLRVCVCVSVYMYPSTPASLPTLNIHTYTHATNTNNHNNSLPNTSDATRWSLDLRWQNARLPAGFWGIKDPILLRKAGDAAFAPDWAGFVAVDRGSAQSKAAHDGAVVKDGG